MRRAAQRAYTALLTNGATEDFATKVPDRTPKIRQELAAIEAECLEAKRRSEETVPHAARVRFETCTEP